VTALGWAIVPVLDLRINRVRFWDHLCSQSGWDDEQEHEMNMKLDYDCIESDSLCESYRQRNTWKSKYAMQILSKNAITVQFSDDSSNHL
jgi:hypothetical protein